MDLLLTTGAALSAARAATAHLVLAHASDNLDEMRQHVEAAMGHAAQSRSDIDRLRQHALIVGRVPGDGGHAPVGRLRDR